MIGVSTTSKSPDRASLSERDASIKGVIAEDNKLSQSPLPTQSAAPDGAPVIPGANRPGVNSSQDNTPVDLNLDLPKRGPDVVPHFSGGAKSESLTQTYEGTVLDAACVAPINARTEPCGISATTTRFALRLKEGQILRFDSVGNLRAQTARKKGRWVSKTLAGKEIRARVSGMIVGNELIAVSID